MLITPSRILGHMFLSKQVGSCDCGKTIIYTCDEKEAIYSYNSTNLKMSN